MKGKLYLLPNLLGKSEINCVIPSGVLEIIHSLDCFIVENVRSARRFLLHSGYSKEINNIEFFILDEHTSNDDIQKYIVACQAGRNMGVLSEAGVPAVADPGARIVELAHKSGIRVIPLVGPSSILLALMSSGLNGQSFSFLGYLPVKKDNLVRRIREIEAISIREKQTQIFIETPYRNLRLFGELIRVCKPSTHLCIALNLTGPEEKISLKRISEWKNTNPDIERKPAVFLLSAAHINTD